MVRCGKLRAPGGWAAAGWAGERLPSLGDLYHSTPVVDGWRLGCAALPPEGIETAACRLGAQR